MAIIEKKKLLRDIGRDCISKTRYGLRVNKFGGDGVRVTPVTIPNTEVKPYIADGTAW